MSCLSSAAAAASYAELSPARAASCIALSASATAMLAALRGFWKSKGAAPDKARERRRGGSQPQGAAETAGGTSQAPGPPARPPTTHAVQVVPSDASFRVPKVAARLFATSAREPAKQVVPKKMAAASSTTWGAPANGGSARGVEGLGRSVGNGIGGRAEAGRHMRRRAQAGRQAQSRSTAGTSTGRGAARWAAADGCRRRWARRTRGGVGLLLLHALGALVHLVQHVGGQQVGLDALLHHLLGGKGGGGVGRGPRKRRAPRHTAPPALPPSLPASLPGAPCPPIAPARGRRRRQRAPRRRIRPPRKC